MVYTTHGIQNSMNSSWRRNLTPWTWTNFHLKRDSDTKVASNIWTNPWKVSSTCRICKTIPQTIHLTFWHWSLWGFTRWCHWCPSPTSCPWTPFLQPCALPATSWQCLDHSDHSALQKLAFPQKNRNTIHCQIFPHVFPTIESHQKHQQDPCFPTVSFRIFSHLKEAVLQQKHGSQVCTGTLTHQHHLEDWEAVITGRSFIVPIPKFHDIAVGGWWSFLR